MNNASQIKEHFQNVNHLLANKQLKQALDELGSFVKDVPEWNLHNLFDEIQTAYRYMLKYFRQNINDPQQTRLHTELIRKTYVLNEQLMTAQFELQSSELYYSTKREQKQNQHSISDYALILESYADDVLMATLLKSGESLQNELKSLRNKHEETYHTLFNKIWTSSNWDAAMQEEARLFLNNINIQTNDICLFVSAVTLGLLHVFDARKFYFLLDACEHPDSMINQRALVGIVLACIYYENRLTVETEILARIKLLEDKPNFIRNLINLQFILLRTRETKKADQKMRDEIIPEVIKRSQQLNRSKINFNEFDEDNIFNEKNPEWKKWEEDNNLTNKMQELGDMQMEGIDVYMSTFAQLKTFPFFRNTCNWFYPFDPQHSVVQQAFPEEEQKKNLIVRSILASSFFCNSDKYSFCLTIQSIPSKQREMFASNMAEQNDMLQETSDLPKPEKATAETICRQYIQDLYRFFKIHPRRHEFTDLFENLSFNFIKCEVLKPFVSSNTDRRKVAEYLFHKEYYLEALQMFEPLTHEPEADAELFQKLGFCFQKEKAYLKAIEAYTQADLRKPDTLWTIKHLAQCYRLLKQPESALPYYLKALEIQPENLTLLLIVGACEMEMCLYDDAFARFFKVEYLDPHSLRAWRSIAWCSFLANKYTQAEKYYNLLLQEEKPEVEDYLNAGHTAWAQCENSQAIDLYLKGIDCKNGDTEAFIALIYKDKEELLNKGISVEEMALMTDVLRYGKIE